MKGNQGVKWKEAYFPTQTHQHRYVPLTRRGAPWPPPPPLPTLLWEWAIDVHRDHAQNKKKDIIFINIYLNI